MASATHLITDEEANAHPPLEAMVVRFAGDSGDGMQLTGGQFTLSTALAGNDLATFPDFPAEIRAPQGTTFGVSAFQINFGSTAIDTAGDQPDVLVAMNPAALKTNARDLRDGGLIIADEGEFTARNLAKAGYDQSPLDDGSLARWQLVRFNISQLTLDAVKPFGLGNKEALRCKNMWTLGLALWMFDRERGPIIDWLKSKFAKKPELAEANIAALNAGHAYGETGRDWRPGSPAPHRRRPPSSRDSTAPSLARNRFRSGWSRRPACRPADVFRRLSDHAGIRDPSPSRPPQGIWHHHLPGGG
jgi:2-oxoglutarate ferredoxin oxidoreductase subunit alpha